MVGEVFSTLFQRSKRTVDFFAHSGVSDKVLRLIPFDTAILFPSNPVSIASTIVILIFIFVYLFQLRHSAPFFCTTCFCFVRSLFLTAFQILWGWMSIFTVLPLCFSWHLSQVKTFWEAFLIFTNTSRCSNVFFYLSFLVCWLNMKWMSYNSALFLWES